MHPYSTDDGSRLRNVLLVLAVSAIFLAWGLGQALLALNLSAPWWLDTPAVMGFYGLLWKLYDRLLWRIGPRDRPLGGVPNFAGTWKGKLHSSFDNQGYDATLIVRQTASRMLVEFRTESSQSHSYLAGASAAPGVGNGLHYLYLNQPAEGAHTAMHPHGGVGRLQFHNGALELRGGYQTDRFRGTHGTLQFELAGNDTSGALT
jgi:hypothetical protein